jgi:PhnB protein
MNPLNPYVFFDGNCAEAMRFYERTLQARIEMMMDETEAPGAKPLPAGKPPRIMHARLGLPGGGTLMASDWMADHPYRGKHGFYVSLVLPSVAEAKRVFGAFAEGGEVNMPFDKTFWSEGFGMVVDRYGTPWMINGRRNPCERVQGVGPMAPGLLSAVRSAALSEATSPRRSLRRSGLPCSRQSNSTVCAMTRCT